MNLPALDESFFRHEYGGLVSRLTRRLGAEHLALIEDAAQAALLTALERWPTAGVPAAPSAWLSRVAYHNVLGELRGDLRRKRLLARESAEPLTADADLAHEDPDGDLLCMLFACCDDRIPPEGQLVLALKTLCGFSTGEIAYRLFLSEENVQKRLSRARAGLRERGALLLDPTDEQCWARLASVHRVLYALFSEGHLSSRPEHSIRRELCDEAIRLATLVASERPNPETCALLALMHLHVARLSAREDPSLGLLLLAEQDRSRWDARQMELGMMWLARSAHGAEFTRYHAEAGIAAEHCLAPSVAETRWAKIVEYYELLERVAPSALHTLNRAVALAEWKGPRAGLELLEQLSAPAWLAERHEWFAVIADLHRRCGDADVARSYACEAVRRAPEPIQAQLRRRFDG